MEVLRRVTSRAQTALFRHGLRPAPLRHGFFERSFHSDTYRLHRQWKHVHVMAHRLETRVGDFRSLATELRLHRRKLEVATEEAEKGRLKDFIQRREKEIATEAVDIHDDLTKLTALFVEGAEREYAFLRGFFLLFVYHFARTSSAFESLVPAEFNKLLTQTTDDVTFEAPKFGTVKLKPRLCKILASAGSNLNVNAVDTDTSPLAISLAIGQAFPQKHCSRPHCRREDCIAVKADHEELFECVFKKQPRLLVFEKCRDELSAEFEDLLMIPKDKPKEPVAEAPSEAATGS